MDSCLLSCSPAAIQKKRPRSANFSNEEKILLMNIISKYKHIIENKKTDTVSTDVKNKAWIRVASEFNSIAPNNISRTAESLKKFFENKKKEVRKIAAEEKRETNLTGGGTLPKLAEDDSHELVLSIINKKSVYGLDNPNDSDSVCVPYSSSNLNRNEVTELNLNSFDDPLNERFDTVVEEVYVDEDQSNISSCLDQSNVPSSSKNYIECSTGTSINKTSEKTNWRKYKPVDLKTPKNICLNVTEKENSSDTVERGQNVASRRRPAVAVRALTSSHLAEKYNTLVEKRLTLTECQLRKTETEIKIANEEHNLKMQILKTKLKIKEDELKLLPK